MRSGLRACAVHDVALEGHGLVLRMADPHTHRCNRHKHCYLLHEFVLLFLYVSEHFGLEFITPLDLFELRDAIRCFVLSRRSHFSKWLISSRASLTDIAYTTPACVASYVG
jgi:hypothetical protein